MTLHACPDCRCADPPPAPSSSDDRKRRIAIAGVRAVIDSNRRARTTVNEKGNE